MAGVDRWRGWCAASASATTEASPVTAPLNRVQPALRRGDTVRVDVVVRTNYEAYAEIVLLTPAQAAREPRSINAADVITHLDPDAAPPKQPQT